MNKIYLVRHGESKANAGRVFSSMPNKYPLTQKGTLQAIDTGKYLKELEIDEIFSSNLLRAFQTATYITYFQSLLPTQIEDFAEIDTGDLEDKPIDEESIAFYYGIVESWISGNHNVTFPGGENFSNALERMQRGLRKVCTGKANKNIVVVAHGGLLTLTLPHICANVTEKEFFKVKSNRYVENCSITEIEAEFTGKELNCTLVSWGKTDHISPALREIRKEA